jgi:ABC-type nitrate/sulfonate/bicarbonate transport system ATPase subunit
MADPLLKIRDLSFGWPQTAPLLQGLNLQLNPGEIVSLVGASGCGKSTLLNLVAGLLNPQNGQITRNYSRQAMVFQNASLLPWRSCRSNVALPLELEGTANAKEKAQAALEQLGLGEHADKLPHSLSGGMQMRTALARALVGEPEVLLLDEAFSALDAITRKSILKQFLALQHRIGFGVLLVTHDIDEAILLSDRVHVLKGAPARLGPATPIEQPRPRDLEWRHSPELGALSRQIEAEL